MNITSKLFSVLLALLSVGSLLYGQTEKRLALVIGNAKYDAAPLKNPVNDAVDVTSKLRPLGFDVTLLKNANLREMENSILQISKNANKYDVVFVYYSGHGFQVGGENYLIPTDAEIESEADVKYECVSLNYILDKLDDSGCPMKIIVLDACRNNPFIRAWYKGDKDKGLSTVNPPKGTYITFATAAGAYASDGEGRNSPYAKAFLSTLDIPNLSLYVFFDIVNNKVLLSTEGEQDPWTNHSTMKGDFVFNKQKQPQITSQTADITATTPSTTVDNSCGTVKDFDGNFYSTVQIGNQCWMAENLRTTHYNNGEPLHFNNADSANIFYEGIYYQPKSHKADYDKYYTTSYGYLYNWIAAIGGYENVKLKSNKIQGLCPKGWHLPSEKEWKQLFDYVKNHYQYGVCGSEKSIAKALASPTGWVYMPTFEDSIGCNVGDPSFENNSTGFGLLPAGCGEYIKDGTPRNLNEVYFGGGNYMSYYASVWGVANEYNSLEPCFYIELCTHYSHVFQETCSNLGHKMSIRCIRD